MGANPASCSSGSCGEIGQSVRLTKRPLIAQTLRLGEYNLSLQWQVLVQITGTNLLFLLASGSIVINVKQLLLWTLTKSSTHIHAKIIGRRRIRSRRAACLYRQNRYTEIWRQSLQNMSWLPQLQWWRTLLEFLQTLSVAHHLDKVTFDYIIWLLVDSVKILHDTANVFAL